MAEGKHVIKYVDDYLWELELEKSLDIAKSIYEVIAGDLRLYVFRRIRSHEFEDVLSETIKAIFTNLTKFRGQTDQEFYAWCHRIARNKIADQFRKQAADRLEPLSIEEIELTVQASAERIPLSEGERLDLEYVMDLLAKSKPECRDLLLNHFVDDVDFLELAKQLNLKYDAVRRRIERCLQAARALLAV